MRDNEGMRGNQRGVRTESKAHKLIYRYTPAKLIYNGNKPAFYASQLLPVLCCCMHGRFRMSPVTCRCRSSPSYLVGKGRVRRAPLVTIFPERFCWCVGLYCNTNTHDPHDSGVVRDRGAAHFRELVTGPLRERLL